MVFHIITIFPEIFSSYFNESILKRAQKNKIIDIKIHDLRQWTDDKHRTVDDTPYGGGAGMVMKVEPIYKALRAIKSQIANRKSQIANKSEIILLSAKGRRWNQRLARKYSKFNELILVCGRYEGTDERIKKFVDEEISIGDYVLTGGEIPAMAIVDSITRLLPNVLGNASSAKDESHSVPGVLEYPQYTRPEIFTPLEIMPRSSTSGFNNQPKFLTGFTVKGKKYQVPKILLSGDHKKIEKWREKKKKIANKKL